MKGLMVAMAVVCAVVWSGPQAEGKTFYLKNGEEIEYQQSWQKDGMIHLLVNRDTLLQFAPEDVNLKRSRVAAQAKIPTRKTAKAATAASASASTSRNVTAAAPKGYKPAPPAVRTELEGVYSKFYAAVRSGDIDEQLKYVTGKQRASVEKFGDASGEGKQLVLELMRRALPEAYVVTRVSIAADNDKATLATVRKYPVEQYEMVDNALVKTGPTRYKNVTGVVSFVKEGSQWKIELVKES